MLTILFIFSATCNLNVQFLCLCSNVRKTKAMFDACQGNNRCYAQKNTTYLSKDWVAVAILGYFAKRWCMARPQVNWSRSSPCVPQASPLGEKDVGLTFGVQSRKVEKRKDIVAKGCEGLLICPCSVFLKTFNRTVTFNVKQHVDDLVTHMVGRGQ